MRGATYVSSERPFVELICRRGVLQGRGGRGPSRTAFISSEREMSFTARITRSCVFVLATCAVAASASAEIFGHHAPYQDRHFELDQTPRYDYGVRPTHGDYYGNVVTRSHHGCTAGECATCRFDGATHVATPAGLHDRDSHGFGSRSPRCPAVDSSILQLYVPDGCQVEVNGYPTKPQTLAGVHRNSRIYRLDGLSQDQFTLCDVVVISCDAYGNQTRSIWQKDVFAGNRYSVRYPQDFQQSVSLHHPPAIMHHAPSLNPMPSAGPVYQDPFQLPVDSQLPFSAAAPGNAAPGNAVPGNVVPAMPGIAHDLVPQQVPVGMGLSEPSQ